MKARMSGPMVLASSSTMIAIGLLAWFVARTPDQIAEERTQRVRLAELRIDDRTPEAVAESFLDAWRRRSWDEAERIAVGEARARVQEKRAGEEQVNSEDRAMAREVWQAMASAELVVSFQRSDLLEEGRMALRGLAAYDFVGRPYRREMEWLVVREGEVWRVERMVNGRVITPLPEVLEGE